MAIKITLNNVRFAYAHVFQPHKFEGDDKEPRYSVTILIPKSNKAEVEKAQSAVQKAYSEAQLTRWGNRKPAKWFNPLQDGDEPNGDGEDRGEAFHNCFFINAKSRVKPGVFTRNSATGSYDPILDTEEFYSGCYGSVSVAFNGFENSGNKGISAFVNNILKLKDGEPLGSGASSPEEDFGAVDTDDL